MRNGSREKRLRVAEIKATLANMKRDFFINGVELPMSVRVSLESEMASLQFELMKEKDSFASRQAQVRQLRAELLKGELAKLGLEYLFEECNERAESQTPKVAEEADEQRI